MKGPCDEGGEDGCGGQEGAIDRLGRTTTAAALCASGPTPAASPMGAIYRAPTDMQTWERVRASEGKARELEGRA
jgi:hypothetical protein